MLLNQSELAAKLGVSQPAVAQAVRRGRLTYVDTAKKLFDLDDAVRDWRAKGERQPRLTVRLDGQSKVGADILESRARREKATADMAELRAGQESRELIPLAVSNRALSLAGVACKQAIERMPSRQQSRVVGLETPERAFAVLTEIATELLSEIHAALKGAKATLPGEAPPE